MTEVEARLRAALAASTEQVAALRRQHTEVVAASAASNADDEHDPEGATIAFERAQVATLLEQVQRSAGELAEALRRHADGSYGRCAGCGRPIGAERLEARPAAATCITCAGRPR